MVIYSCGWFCGLYLRNRKLPKYKILYGNIKKFDKVLNFDILTNTKGKLKYEKNINNDFIFYWLLFRIYNG